MAKGPGVSATSHISAQSQTNIHYYSDLPMQMQQVIFIISKQTNLPFFASSQSYTRGREFWRHWWNAE